MLLDKKTNKILFISSQIFSQLITQVLTKQSLKKLNLTYFSFRINTILNRLNTLIFIKNKHITQKNLFFIYLCQNKKLYYLKTIKNNFKDLKINCLVLKLNNNIYTKNTTKNLTTFKYKKNKLVLYQFFITNSKNN